jgi:hypothetical protein
LQVFDHNRLVLAAEIGGDLVPPVLPDIGDPLVNAGNLDPGLVSIRASLLPTMELPIRAGKLAKIGTEGLRPLDGIAMRGDHGGFESQIHANDRVFMNVRTYDARLDIDRDKPLISPAGHPS